MADDEDTRCECIKCSKAMNNIADKGLQPSGGLAFSTRGHYGSTYFDPMDGTYLEIAICDECLREIEKAGYVYRSSKGLPPTVSFDEASPGGICHMGHSWEVLTHGAKRRCIRCGEVNWV